MCKIANYPSLYTKTDEGLRRAGISAMQPGYEFLKIAIVTQKVEGRFSCEEIGKGKVIPSNKDVDLRKKGDRPEIIQWMIEAIKSAGIGEGKDAEESLNEFICQQAKML